MVTVLMWLLPRELRDRIESVALPVIAALDVAGLVYIVYRMRELYGTPSRTQ